MALLKLLSLLPSARTSLLLVKKSKNIENLFTNLLIKLIVLIWKTVLTIMSVSIVLILNLSPAIVVIVLLVHVTAVLNIRIVAMISIDTRLIFLIKNIEKTLLILERVSICHMKNAKLWLILSFRLLKPGILPIISLPIILNWIFLKKRSTTILKMVSLENLDFSISILESKQKEK